MAEVSEKLISEGVLLAVGTCIVYSGSIAYQTFYLAAFGVSPVFVEFRLSTGTIGFLVLAAFTVMGVGGVMVWRGTRFMKWMLIVPAAFGLVMGSWTRGFVGAIFEVVGFVVSVVLIGVLLTWDGPRDAGRARAYRATAIAVVWLTLMIYSGLAGAWSAHRTESMSMITQGGRWIIVAPYADGFVCASWNEASRTVGERTCLVGAGSEEMKNVENVRVPFWVTGKTVH